jgi:hypothetical protein
LVARRIDAFLIVLGQQMVLSVRLQPDIRQIVTITTEQLAVSEAQAADFVQTRRADNPYLVSATSGTSGEVRGASHDWLTTSEQAKVGRVKFVLRPCPISWDSQDPPGSWPGPPAMGGASVIIGLDKTTDWMVGVLISGGRQQLGAIVLAMFEVSATGRPKPRAGDG